MLIKSIPIIAFDNSRTTFIYLEFQVESLMIKVYILTARKSEGIAEVQILKLHFNSTGSRIKM